MEYPPSRWNPTRDKAIVHIDPLPAEVDRAYCPAVEVGGSIAAALERLTELSPGRGKGPPPERGRGLRDFIQKEFGAEEHSEAWPAKPQRIVRALRTVLGDDDILVSDVGAHKLWIARMYPCARPNTCILSNGYASMGIALPGAIGAKLLYPDRRVLAACGDGGFLMTVEELETAVRVGAPIVVFIFEDASYGVIRWHQMKRYGRPAFVDFGNPDFVQLARSFGCAGYRVERSQDLERVLDAAFHETVPSVVVCPVDYSENLRLTEALGGWVCPI